MNISVFSQNSGGGGAERVATVLANEFSEDNKVFYCSIRENGYYPLKAEIEKRTFDYGGAFSQIKRIAAFLKEEKIDAVYAIGSPVVIKIALAKTVFRRRFSFIASERNDPEREITSSIKKKLREWAYKKADAVVFQTEDAKNYFPKKIRDKGVVILNPVIAKSESEVDISGGYNRIIAAGRIDPQKNFSLLVKAFAIFSEKNSDYILDIFGSKNNETEYEKIAGAVKENGLENKVSFKGFTENLYGEYLKSSIYVSSSDYEGISNSMLEAMSAGLPVVCTDCPCGGARAVVNDGVNGLLVPVGDEKALAEALDKLAGDEKLRKRLSAEAVKIREKLSVKKIFNEWESLLETYPRGKK